MQVALLVALVVLAALCDKREGRIPNGLTLSYGLIGVELGGLSSAIAYFTCGLGLLLLRPRWEVGGGDCKLLAAIGSLHPVVGIGVLYASLLDHGRIRWRLGPSACAWTLALLCLLEVR